MTRMVVYESGNVARTLDGFGLHAAGEIAMHDFVNPARSLARPREGTSGRLAQFTTMARVRYGHGGTVDIHAYSGRGTVGLQRHMGHMPNTLMPDVQRNGCAPCVSIEGCHGCVQPIKIVFQVP